MNEYKNEKVNVVMRKVSAFGWFTSQDFADLAVACADQAGMSIKDQSLFEQLLTAAIEDRKNQRLS